MNYHGALRHGLSVRAPYPPATCDFARSIQRATAAATITSSTEFVSTAASLTSDVLQQPPALLRRATQRRISSGLLSCSSTVSRLLRKRCAGQRGQFVAKHCRKWHRPTFPRLGGAPNQSTRLRNGTRHVHSAAQHVEILDPQHSHLIPPQAGVREEPHHLALPFHRRCESDDLRMPEVATVRMLVSGVSADMKNYPLADMKMPISGQ